MSNFKKLAVWEKAHQLTLHIYRVTADFPKEELFGLTNQVRRASVSIAANIVEGAGQGGGKEMVQFLRIAQGSAHEVEYHLLLARDLNFLDFEVHQQLEQKIIEIQRMLAGLMSTISAKN